MKEEKIHLLDYTTFTKDRSEYMNFSRSYIGIDYVILTTDDNSGYINSIEKIINKYKVGTVQDYAVSENIKKDYPGIEHFREYENPEEGLKALSSKQIDFFIINIPAFEYYSKKYSLSNLRIAGPAGYSFNCGFGIKKDEKVLFSIINKILGQISKEDIDKIYRKWVKVEFEEKIDYDLIWKIVLASLAILLGTLYWNRKLKIEITQKEIVQEKLSQSKNFINSIMNSQLDIIVVTDGKDIRQVNQSFFNFFKCKDIDSFKKRYRCYDAPNEWI
jgi:hypothetical protein